MRVRLMMKYTRRTKGARQRGGGMALTVSRCLDRGAFERMRDAAETPRYSRYIGSGRMRRLFPGQKRDREREAVLRVPFCILIARKAVPFRFLL